MKKIRLTSFTPSAKNDVEERVKNLEKYMVILQRELEYAINIQKDEEGESYVS